MIALKGLIARYGVLILICSVFLIGSYITNKSKAIHVKDINWTPTSGKIDVSFTLYNNKKKDLVANVYIAVYGTPFSLSLARGNPVVDLVGDKRISIELKGGEKKVVKETVVLSPLAKADKVDVMVNASAPK
ncbi:MAG: hypothetical protein Q8O13_00685 [Candidatus Omnitrophota bacterium]|nr:hypothetical protein [Candidatus Omnitrophota bacterium]